MKRSGWAFASVVFASALACGSGSDGTTSTAGDGGGADGSAPAADASAAATDGGVGTNDASPTNDAAASGDGSTGSCAPPGYSPSVVTLTPGVITATIKDGADTPIGTLLTSVTGLDLALTGLTAADGTVSINLNHAVKNPAFRLGDGLTYGEFVVPITAPGAALGTLHTAALPASGSQLVPGSTSTSGPLSLSLASGSTVAFDALTYDTADKQKLRAALVPIALAPVDATLGLELVVATAPLGTLFCPPAKVRVPNSGGWAASAKVDFYVLGLDVGQGYAPYGGWAKVSGGQVTSDGTAIETDAGAGIATLGTLGIRRR